MRLFFNSAERVIKIRYHSHIYKLFNLCLFSQGNEDNRRIRICGILSLFGSIFEHDMRTTSYWNLSKRKKYNHSLSLMKFVNLKMSIFFLPFKGLL